MTDAGPILAQWQLACPADTLATVWPDGCRDLILHVDARGRPHWFVTKRAQGALRRAPEIQQTLLEAGFN